MESAQEIVVAEWQRRRAVQLDISGGWHVCHRDRCTIQHLNEYVCLQGAHLVGGLRCAEHPRANVIHVQNLYGCAQVGATHVCSQSPATCTTVDGKCTISGLSCVAPPVVPVPCAPPCSKRARRRQSGVHTNLKVASILLFNLLFSRRRVANEVGRARGTLEHGRRQALRYIKATIRDQTCLRYQNVVDILNQARQTVRNTQYQVTCQDAAVREQICLYYAGILVDMWELLISHLPARNTFECICAALLYTMRKGLAYDGLFAIPPDRFLLYALPDAHSIKDIGISRRAFTQSRNALYTVIRSIVAKRYISVENIALKFKRDDNRPAVLTTHFAQDAEQQ